MGLADIHIEEGKDPKSYTLLERRSEILRLILKAGHPGMIKAGQICSRYGVSETVIRNDLTKIKEEINEILPKDSKVVVNSIFYKALMKLSESSDTKDLKSAALLAKEWYEWLAFTGDVYRAPDKVEHVGGNIVLNISGVDLSEYPSLDEKKDSSKEI